MSEPEVRVVVPEAHYTLFNGQRSGLPEVIVVNDALMRFAEIEIFPWHLRVEMQAKDLIENGMPSRPRANCSLPSETRSKALC
jgi:hypothetical protein